MGAPPNVAPGVKKDLTWAADLCLRRLKSEEWYSGFRDRLLLAGKNMQEMDALAGLCFADLETVSENPDLQAFYVALRFDGYSHAEARYYALTEEEEADAPTICG